ncbi:hypothetical protein [Catenulispora sp. GAS73]|uniref:hypothetical protein n=1 Tax=Catenulispora sp. GAS73 TaxID=3156269 RepID=UPI00351322B7
MSAARPGRTHDTTAACHDYIVAAGVGAPAALGFLGVDKPTDLDDLVIVTGYKVTRYRRLTTGQKTANKVIAAGRAPVEHGFAHLVSPLASAAAPNSKRAGTARRWWVKRASCQRSSDSRARNRLAGSSGRAARATTPRRSSRTGSTDA